jgi:hypothetical protein
MKPEVKAKWLEALRSGDYKQGKDGLRKNDDTFCCLGVLCDVYRKETGDGLWVPYGVAHHAFAVGGIRHPSYLPTKVSAWAGLNDIDPEGPDMPLSAYNDKGEPFEEIAKMIEEEL